MWSKIKLETFDDQFRLCGRLDFYSDSKELGRGAGGVVYRHPKSSDIAIKLLKRRVNLQGAGYNSILANIGQTDDQDWLGTSAIDPSTWMKEYRNAGQRLLSLLEIGTKEDVWKVDGRQFVLGWPSHGLRIANTDRIVGFTMPSFEGWVSLEDLVQEKDSKTAGYQVDGRKRLDIAINLAKAVEYLHRLGIFIVDLKPQNIMVNEARGTVGIIDLDAVSMIAASRFGNKRLAAPNSTDEYGSPEWFKRPTQRTGVFDKSEDHDRFALAVIIYKMLNGGLHPYAGTWIGTQTISDIATRVAKELFPYGNGQGIITPHSKSLVEYWPEKLKAVIIRSFGPMGNRVTPEEWSVCLKNLARNGVICTTDPEHFVFEGMSCAVCVRDQVNTPNYAQNVIGGAGSASGPYPLLAKRRPAPGTPYGGSPVFAYAGRASQNVKQVTPQTPAASAGLAPQSTLHQGSKVAGGHGQVRPSTPDKNQLGVGAAIILLTLAAIWLVNTSHTKDLEKARQQRVVQQNKSRFEAIRQKRLLQEKTAATKRLQQEQEVRNRRLVNEERARKLRLDNLVKAQWRMTMTSLYQISYKAYCAGLSGASMGQPKLEVALGRWYCEFIIRRRAGQVIELEHRFPACRARGAVSHHYGVRDAHWLRCRKRWLREALNSPSFVKRGSRLETGSLVAEGWQKRRRWEREAANANRDFDKTIIDLRTSKKKRRINYLHGLNVAFPQRIARRWSRQKTHQSRRSGQTPNGHAIVRRARSSVDIFSGMAIASKKKCFRNTGKRYCEYVIERWAKQQAWEVIQKHPQCRMYWSRNFIEAFVGLKEKLYVRCQSL